MTFNPAAQDCCCWCACVFWSNWLWSCTNNLVQRRRCFQDLLGCNTIYCLHGLVMSSVSLRCQCCFVLVRRFCSNLCSCWFQWHVAHCKKVQSLHSLLFALLPAVFVFWLLLQTGLLLVSACKLAALCNLVCNKVRQVACVIFEQLKHVIDASWFGLLSGCTGTHQLFDSNTKVSYRLPKKDALKCIVCGHKQYQKLWPSHNHTVVVHTHVGAFFLCLWPYCRATMRL